MSEISDSSSDAIETGSETGSNETTEMSSTTETVSSTESRETGGSVNEVVSSGPVQETTSTAAAQAHIEQTHQDALTSILSENGKYMSVQDQSRINEGVSSLRIVESGNRNVTGSYRYESGKSHIEIANQNEHQRERSTIHETFHFTSRNREIIVPDPERNGYTVYKTVGTRQSSWFHNNRTGELSNYSERGRGMNEGLTTMYTNRELAKTSPERAEEAQRQMIYSHAEELCTSLEKQVGEDALKEAYFGGDTRSLETQVNTLAGEQEYAHLRDCLDRSISKDYAERVEATKEAQEILARMAENKERMESA